MKGGWVRNRRMMGRMMMDGWKVVVKAVGYPGMSS